MKFQAKGGADFEPVPAGNHVAICNAIVDLGLQPGTSMYPEPKRQVYIRFELPTERVDFERDGRKVNGPMSIGQRFTASMSKKGNLRKFIESWFGKKFPTDEAAAAFDLMQLIDKNCLLNVTHNVGTERTYANITGASPLPKGMRAPAKSENSPLMFDLDEPDDEMFQQLPAWLQALISKRLAEPKEPAAHAAKSPAAPTAVRAASHAPDPRIARTDTDLPTGENFEPDDIEQMAPF